MAIQDTEISRIRAATLKNTNKLKCINNDGTEIDVLSLSASYITGNISSSVITSSFASFDSVYTSNLTSSNSNLEIINSNNLSASNINVTNVLNSNYLKINNTVNSSLVPSSNKFYDLGIHSIYDDILYWNKLYVKTVKLSSDGGIDFSSNGSASGIDSAILDDYEEGTWDVTLYGTWTNEGTVNSKYIKIGRQVNIMIFVNNSGGNLDFSEYAATNLPFVVTGNPAYAGYCCGIRALGTVIGSIKLPPSFPGQSEILPVQIDTNYDRLYILKDSSMSYEQGVAIFCSYYTSS